MRRLFLLALLSLLFIPNAKAQILNVEKFRLDADTSKVWLGSIGMWASGKRQQTNVFTFLNKTNIAYLSEKHSYMFLGYLKLIKVAGSDVISEGYGHMRFNFFRKNKFSLEQFNQLQYDMGRGMTRRGLIGLSGRYEIASNEKIEFAAASGLMFEDEVWEESDSTNIANVNLKSSSNLILTWKIKKWLTFLGITYYQARFDRYFKPRLITDASLQFAFTDKFGLRLQYVATYDSEPIIPIDKLIYAVNSTLVFKF